ncbi:hypothetical protein CR513_12267, partial [Mucuna pruriens]
MQKEKRTKGIKSKSQSIAGDQWSRDARLAKIGKWSREYQIQSSACKSIKASMKSAKARSGSILDLLKVEVQLEALTALVQFYGPPLRTFLFQDFQMAPTLDEYERILDQPLTKNPPYLYQGNFSSWGQMAKLLKVEETKILNRKQKRSGIDNLPLAYLEERMKICAKEDFINILGLAIYGIILLPHLDEYIDLPAIDVFLANQERGRNPVTTVLANTYYTIQKCHEKGGRQGKNGHTFSRILSIKSSASILNGTSGRRYGIGVEDSLTFP